MEDPVYKKSIEFLIQEIDLYKEIIKIISKIIITSKNNLLNNTS